MSASSPHNQYRVVDDKDVVLSDHPSMPDASAAAQRFSRRNSGLVRMQVREGSDWWTLESWFKGQKV